MSLCRHLASALLALLVSSAVAVAEERKIDDGQGLAEPAPRAVEQTDRIVACAAGLLDLDAFKRLLTEGEREQLAIERKLRRGQYERVAPLDSKIARTSAAGLIRRIQENLAALDGSERTAALLYDLQKDETTAATFLCSWLVTSHHVRLYRGEFLWPSLTAFVQHGLRVTARAAARAPVLSASRRRPGRKRCRRRRRIMSARCSPKPPTCCWRPRSGTRSSKPALTGC